MDHTHAALYIGDGKVVEANASTGKVGERDVFKALSHKSHIVAIRPNYTEGQAEKVVAQARAYKGRRYDWFASMSDKRLGCVEVPFHALAKAAPEHEVPVTNLWGVKKFVFPGDYLQTLDSSVVAEAGIARSAGAMRLAKYSWAARELELEQISSAARQEADSK